MTSRTHTSCSTPLRLAIAAALALTLSTPLQANDPNKETKTSAQAGQTMAADRTFLDTAITGSEKEVAATILARERASDAKVRELATHLQRDHLSLLSRLDETAVALGVRDTRTYHDVASTDSSAPAGYAATGADTGTAADTGAASSVADADTKASGVESDTTASTGYVDDVTASGSSKLGGSTIDAPGASGAPSPAASASSGTMNESAALSTPGVTTARLDPSLQALAREAGPPFDRAFLDQLISSHEKSVAEFTKASQDMSLSAQSRSLAEQSLPTLRDHLEMTRNLRSSLATN